MLYYTSGELNHIVADALRYASVCEQVSRFIYAVGGYGQSIRKGHFAHFGRPSGPARRSGAIRGIKGEPEALDNIRES